MTNWLHFIGGHYSDDYRFILEARRNGISRNVPPQTARGFHYGDTVQLLRWKRGGKQVYAFAEMVVNSVIFPHNISQKLVEHLDINVHYDPSPLHIDRDCGSYDLSGCWTVDSSIDIPDLVKAAMEVAGDEKFRCMIGGRLLKEYDKPVRIDGVKFTRGFQKAPALYKEPVDEPHQILGIDNYRRK